VGLYIERGGSRFQSEKTMPVLDACFVGKIYLPEIGGGPMPGGPPLGIWGGGGVGNYPDAGFPGPQPGRPVRPTHPIYYPPTGIWGGGGVGNYPDAGFPGPQPGGPIGIWGGGGVGNYPDAGFPGPQPGGPIGIWGGGGVGNYPDAGFPGPQPGGPVYPTTGPGFPSYPIYIPPGSSGGGSGNAPSQPVNTPPTDSPYWQNVFIPRIGWVWAIVPPQGEGEAVSSENPLAR
jgi:hypothetical protein